MVTEILTDLDIGTFTLKLNHRRLLDAMLDIAGVPPQKFRCHLLRVPIHPSSVPHFLITAHDLPSTPGGQASCRRIFVPSLAGLALQKVPDLRPWTDTRVLSPFRGHLRQNMYWEN